MARPVIVVAEQAFAGHEALREYFAERAELRFEDLSDPDAIRTATRGAAAVVVTLQRLTRRSILHFDDSVQVIGRAGVGLDSLDLECAAERGVAVFNEPAYGALEVASHAVALLLAVQRRLTESDRLVRDGRIGSASLAEVAPLDEMTVGIIGCGRIGAATVDRLAPLVGSVLVYDPAPAGVPAAAIRTADLDELLTRSDAISLHLPLVPSTRHLIGERELGLLPRGAIVVNVARGGIVDERALADALDRGHLSGAGLDVFEDEPVPASSRLLTTPNTLLTPHCASTSARSARRLPYWTIGDAVDWVTTGTLQHGSLVVDGRSSSILAPSTT